MIGISSPGIRVFERKRESVVDCSDSNLWQFDHVPVVRLVSWDGRSTAIVPKAVVLIRGSERDEVVVDWVSTAGKATGWIMSWRLVVLDQPVIVSTIRVSDDVIEHNQTFKLILELLTHSLGERLLLESPKPVIGVFVPVDEQLEWTRLWRKRHSLKARSWHSLLDGSLNFCLLSINAGIVERLRH